MAFFEGGVEAFAAANAVNDILHTEENPLTERCEWPFLTLFLRGENPKVPQHDNHEDRQGNVDHHAGRVQNDAPHLEFLG